MLTRPGRNQTELPNDVLLSNTTINNKRSIPVYRGAELDSAAVSSLCQGFDLQGEVTQTSSTEKHVPNCIIKAFVFTCFPTYY